MDLRALKKIFMDLPSHKLRHILTTAEIPNGRSFGFSKRIDEQYDVATYVTH
jgi:hypothetical protein